MDVGWCSRPPVAPPCDSLSVPTDTGYAAISSGDDQGCALDSSGRSPELCDYCSLPCINCFPGRGLYLSELAIGLSNLHVYGTAHRPRNAPGLPEERRSAWHETSHLKEIFMSFMPGKYTLDGTGKVNLILGRREVPGDPIYKVLLNVNQYHVEDFDFGRFYPDSAEGRHRVILDVIEASLLDIARGVGADTEPLEYAANQTRACSFDRAIFLDRLSRHHRSRRLTVSLFFRLSRAGLWCGIRVANRRTNDTHTPWVLKRQRIGDWKRSFPVSSGSTTKSSALILMAGKLADSMSHPTSSAWRQAVRENQECQAPLARQPGLLPVEAGWCQQRARTWG